MHLQSTIALLPLLALLASAANTVVVQTCSRTVTFDDGKFHHCQFNDSDNFEAENDRTYRKMKDVEPVEEKFLAVPGQVITIIDSSSSSSTTTTSSSHTVITTTAGRRGRYASGNDNEEEEEEEDTGVDNDDDEEEEEDNEGEDDEEEEEDEDESSAYGKPIVPTIPPTRFFTRDNTDILDAQTGACRMNINKTVALRINGKENKGRHLRKNKLYPSHTKCLAVRRRGFRGRWRAVLMHCNDDQRFWQRSPLSFRFQKVAENRVWLTWFAPDGVKHCLRHDTLATRFYPCTDSSKRPQELILVPTYVPGKFKIRDSKRNRCFNGWHRNLWQSRCRGFRHQAWDLIDVNSA
jgi:hypothetical protein